MSPSRQHPSNGDMPERRKAPDGSSEELALESLRELARTIIEPGSKQPMGIYLFRPDEPGAALPLHVERTVFEEAFDNAPKLLASELGPYDHASLLICVMDQHRRLPAGMLRLIFPSSQGLKSLNDIKPLWGIPYEEMFAYSEIDFDAHMTWDIATLAIAPEYRSAAFQGMVTMALFQAISLVGMRCGFESSVAVLHLPILRILQWKLHHPFGEPLGVEPRGYLESPASLPVWMRLPDWHQRLSERDPTLYD